MFFVIASACVSQISTEEERDLAPIMSPTSEAVQESDDHNEQDIEVAHQTGEFEPPPNV